MNGKPLALLVAATLIPGVVTYGHHSFAGTYHEDQLASIEGELVQFAYRNPHAYVHVLVEGEDGEVERWSIEWGGVTQLNRQGVDRFTLKPGDRVVVTGAPGRNPGDHRLLMRGIERLADGWSWGRRPEEVVD
jgi:hypothetical protein